jgi:hypothetical protein
MGNRSSSTAAAPASSSIRSSGQGNDEDALTNPSGVFLSDELNGKWKMLRLCTVVFIANKKTSGTS